MLGKQFMLKDLPFHEVTYFVDSEARQARFDTQEKKHQEGTLCQAHGSTSWAISGLVPQLAKKITIAHPQAQETVTKLSKTFGVEMSE